jgi:alpha-N-arabinofuranosidase
MYRDHFGVIPVEVSGDSPQPKVTFPVGGDQPAVNPGSDTYPLDVVAAFSEDKKTLTIAVLNPSEAKHSMKLALNGVKLAGAGKMWQMAPSKLDAVVTLGKTPEVAVEEHALGALSETIEAPPFSVSIYSYPVQ